LHQNENLQLWWRRVFDKPHERQQAVGAIQKATESYLIPEKIHPQVKRVGGA